MKPVEGERDLGSEPVERKTHTGGVKEDHQGGSDHYSSDYDKHPHKTHHGGTGETHKQGHAEVQKSYSGHLDIHNNDDLPNVHSIDVNFPKNWETVKEGDEGTVNATINP